MSTGTNPNVMFPSKLPEVGTAIFTIMAGMANACGAINLSQGFPNFDVDAELKKAAELLCSI